MNPCFTRLLLCLCVIFSFHFSFSQALCGFDRQHRVAMASDPAYKARVESSDKRLNDYIQRMSMTSQIPLATLYRIPVVVHVIHQGEAIGTGTNISDAQIQSAITSLNEFFRNAFGTSTDVEIEFELANINPSCQATSGIDRIDGSSTSDYATNGITIPPFATENQSVVKALSTWSNRDYYNIWIVSEINNNNGGAGIQGYATFPTPLAIDGAVILYNAFGYDPGAALGYNLKSYTQLNKTLVHEMGHAFKLYHSFEGDDSNADGIADICPPNASCGTDGDMVCDTDPHQRSASNCPSGVNGCTGGSIIPLAHNFMDYSSQVCQESFTSGQVTRMRAALELERASLINSIALTNIYPITPYTTPVAASCTPVTSATGLSADYAGIVNVAINGRNFGSLTPRLDNNINGYFNSTPDCHFLTSLVRGGTYSFSASVWAVNQEQLRVWIDYNNNGVFDNATEQIYINTSIPSHPTDYVTVGGNFTVPVTATTNTVLRLRIVEDLIPGYPSAVPIASGCHNPVYGQAEDYALLLSSSLPIVLQSFTGKMNNGDVTLNWLTSLEQNAKEYQVEKSTDGINFQRIGVVPATRNSNSARHYGHTDKTITQENNYYRLKLVDMDGQFEFSKIVHIKNPIAARIPFNLLNNPIVNNLDIAFGETATGKVQVRLTDITGKLILTWNGEQVANQRVRINIPGKNLTKGVYILQSRIDDKEYVEKVIVQ